MKILVKTFLRFINFSTVIRTFYSDGLISIFIFLYAHPLPLHCSHQWVPTLLPVQLLLPPSPLWNHVLCSWAPLTHSEGKVNNKSGCIPCGCIILSCTSLAMRVTRHPVLTKGNTFCSSMQRHDLVHDFKNGSIHKLTSQLPHEPQNYSWQSKYYSKRIVRSFRLSYRGS